MQETGAARTRPGMRTTFWKPFQRIAQPVGFKSCQFMEGKPSADDGCKCGALTMDGVYCQAHRNRCYIGQARKDKRAA